MSIPRMRTIANAVKEMQKLDPDSNITEYMVRQGVKNGTIPAKMVGRRYLINIDEWIAQLNTPELKPVSAAYKKPVEIPTGYGKVREIAE